MSQTVYEKKNQSDQVRIKLLVSLLVINSQLQETCKFARKRHEQLNDRTTGNTTVVHRERIQLSEWVLTMVPLRMLSSADSLSAASICHHWSHWFHYMHSPAPFRGSFVDTMLLTAAGPAGGAAPAAARPPADRCSPWQATRHYGKHNTSINPYIGSLAEWAWLEKTTALSHKAADAGRTASCFLLYNVEGADQLLDVLSPACSARMLVQHKGGWGGRKRWRTRSPSLSVYPSGLNHQQEAFSPNTQSGELISVSVSQLVGLPTVIKMIPCKTQGTGAPHRSQSQIIKKRLHTALLSSSLAEQATCDAWWWR